MCLPPLLDNRTTNQHCSQLKSVLLAGVGSFPSDYTKKTAGKISNRFKTASDVI